MNKMNKLESGKEKIEEKNVELKRSLAGFEEIEEIIGKGEIKRLAEFIDATNKLSGIVLKKAELDKNFQGVYSNAVRKLVEFQFIAMDEIESENALNNEFFLEIFGETGG